MAALVCAEDEDDDKDAVDDATIGAPEPFVFLLPANGASNPGGARVCSGLLQAFCA